MPTLSRILRKFEEKALKKGFRKGLKQGLQQGLQEGLKQGLQKGKKEVAINMFKRNFDIQTISEILNVDVETIKSWLKEGGLL